MPRMLRRKIVAARPSKRRFGKRYVPVLVNEHGRLVMQGHATRTRNQSRAGTVSLLYTTGAVVPSASAPSGGVSGSGSTYVGAWRDPRFGRLVEV